MLYCMCWHKEGGGGREKKKFSLQIPRAIAKRLPSSLSSSLFPRLSYTTFLFLLRFLPSSPFPAIFPSSWRFHFSLAEKEKKLSCSLYAAAPILEKIFGLLLRPHFLSFPLLENPKARKKLITFLFPSSYIYHSSCLPRRRRPFTERGRRGNWRIFGDLFV